MSTQATSEQVNEAASEQAQVEQPVTQEPGKDTSPATVESGLPTDIDAINAFFTEGKAISVGADSVSEESQQNAEQQAEEQEEANPDTEEETSQETEAEDGKQESDRVLPNRISSKQFNEVEQRAIALRKELTDRGEDVDLEECMKRVKSLYQPKQKPDTQTEQPTVEPTQSEVLAQKEADIRSKLAQLREQRKQFASDERLYGTELNDLASQIEDIEESLVDVRLELKLAKREEQAQETSSKAERQRTDLERREQAKAAVLARFPSAGDKRTPLGSKVASLVSEMQDPSHPDHALLFATNAAGFITERAVALVAQELAAKQGVSYAQAYESLLAKPEAKPKLSHNGDTTRKVMPAPGGKTTSAPAKAKSESEVLAELTKDPTKLDAALYGGRNTFFIGR